MIIRLLTPSLDWDEFLDLTMRSFGPMDAARTRANIEPVVAAGRGLGAFDGGRLVGSALDLDMRQWWHGRAVPMAGVAGVMVAPEERGRGVGRTLVTALLELITARGYPLSVLFPSTLPIYRSLGWEIAGTSHEAYLKSMFTEAQVRAYPNAEAAREALRNKEVDLLFGDGIALAFWLNGADSAGCCSFRGGPFLESRFFGEGIGIAVKRDNDLLRLTLNWALFQLWEKGSFTDLWLRYFPISPF